VPTEPMNQRIANDLRVAIHCGDYLPGHRLPSGRTLMRKYGVARQTVQNAFDLLRGEGLIVTRPGAGAFVRDHQAVVRLDRSCGSAGGVTVRTRTEPADSYSAGTLGLEPGEEVFVRERVTHADGEPVQLATSRLPAKIDADYQPGRFVEYVSARPARPDEAASLGLASGAPILCVTRIAFDRVGRPVEVNDMILAGTRCELVYEIPAD
jgi:GntR family transcriptional regulator